MRERTRRARRRVAAVALALVLVTGGVAPAFAAAAPAPSGPGSTEAHQSDSRTTRLPNAPDRHQSSSPGARSTGLSPASDVVDPASLPDANVTVLDGGGTVTNDDVSDAGRTDASSNATEMRVTLVTGQTVAVVREANRTRYRVSADERMRTVTTDNTTYVYPAGVDFETFDRQLFDVEFLVAQNLTDAATDSIPIIVSGGDRSRRASTGDVRREGALDSVASVERRARLDSIGAEAGSVAKSRAAAAAAELAADPRVDRVTLDVKYRLQLEDADDSAAASTARRVHGVSGEGVTVAVIDSGIDNSHPAIDRVVAERDFTHEGRTDDPNGHGTHVAGIVAGDDETYTGMAPNASLVDVRVLTSEGWGFTSWIIDGMEYATANGADVISMSLGGPVNAERSNDRYAAAVDSAVESGTLVVVSAGNGGPGYRTVTTPGIQSKALTVGASYDDGSVARFSSRGPTKYGHFLKPDLIAPGFGVVSAEAGTDGFTRKSGTSMAAPAVSGVAALLLEKHPGWSPRRVKSVLTTTADPLPVPDVYTQGAGGVNATDALGTDLVVSPGTVDFGTVRSDRSESETVTLTNRGNETIRVDASATATDIEDGDTVPVPVNRSSVSVAPGETTRLELSPDASVPPGVYSGRLSLGPNHTVVFGFLRVHEVTVEKVGAAGTSVDGDPVRLFADRQGRSKLTGREGYATLDGSAGPPGANASSVTLRSVEGGRYHLLSHGRDEETGRPVVFSKTVTVDGDEHVVLNESDTVARSLDASRLDHPSGTLSTRSVKVSYSRRTSAGRRYGGSVAAASPDDATVRFNPNAELNATVGRVLVADGTGTASDASGGDSSTAAASDFDAPAVYQLVRRIGGVGDGGTTTVDPSELAATNLTYYRATRDGSYDVTLNATAEGPAGGRFSHAVTDSLGERRRQTVYLGPGVETHDVSATGGTGASAWRLNASAPYSPVAGATREVGVNRHPFVGDLRWRLDGGTVSYRAAAQADGAGHRFADGSADRVRVRKGGRTVLDRQLPSTPTWRDAGVSVSPGTRLAVTVDGSNGATPLSTRSVTTLRTTYEAGGDNRPPPIRDVSFRRQTANNTVGGRATVRVVTGPEASGLDAFAATGEATTPFDGDAGGWREAAVERVSSSARATEWDVTVETGELLGDAVGRLDLALRANDGEGNAFETTTFEALRADAKAPTVDLEAVGRNDSTADVSGSRTVHTNDTVTARFAAGGTPGRAAAVDALLSAEFANFDVRSAARRADGRWTATADLSYLPDDGAYALEAAATDRFGNANATGSGVTVVLDRKPPDLGATVSRAGNDGRVTLTSDEPLATDSPTATVGKPAGNDERVALTRNESAGEYVWDATFSLAGAGDYAVNASAADPAGNVGEAVSSVEVERVTTAGGNGTVVFERSGTFVELRTSADVESTVTLTESESALAPLSRNLAGVRFLNGELGSNLTDRLDDATIGVPVNESRLPAGVEPEAVDVSYYDEVDGAWEPLNTSVERRTVGGETRAYWVANVTHFSTYGAVVDDRQAPTLDARTPDGTTFDWGTTRRRVTFEYSDDVSGVDASAVELYFDGERVTDAAGASVTGEYATYDATGLEAGEHTAEVVVVDEAGNRRTYTTGFTVERDSTPPSVASSRPADGAELPADAASVELAVDVTDDVSGVVPDAVRVTLDGEDVTDAATVTSTRISYTAMSLAAGSSHTFEVYLEDAAGNGAVHAVDFSVAGESSGGSGGGGGGDVPPPSVNVEVTDRTPTYARAKVTSARAGSPGVVPLAGGLRAGDATVGSVTVVPKSRDATPRFFVEARGSGSAPGGVGEFGATNEALGYLTVTPTYVGDDELSAVEFTVGVDAARVDSPENVALYRYDGGGWSRVRATYLGEADGSARFRATADATGTFAVGLDPAEFEVRDASLDATSVAPDEPVTVTASVENVGAGTGTYAAELTVDGEVVATRTVTLAGGEETTVEFVRTFASGEHDVAVGPAGAGALAVGDVEAESSDGSADDGGDRETSRNPAGSDSGVPGFGVPAAILALVVGALFARRRGV